MIRPDKPFPPMSKRPNPKTVLRNRVPYTPGTLKRTSPPPVGKGAVKVPRANIFRVELSRTELEAVAEGLTWVTGTVADRLAGRVKAVLEK